MTFAQATGRSTCQKCSEGVPALRASGPSRCGKDACVSEPSRIEQKLAALSFHRKLHCGVAVEPTHLGSVATAGWDFVAVPLSAGLEAPFSDLVLPTAAWQSHVVGLTAATDEGILARELSFARHLGLPAIVCPLELAERPAMLRHIVVHLSDEHAPPVLIRSDWTESAWRRWHRVRRMAAYDRRLMLCLDASTAPPALERFLAEPVECLFVAGDWDRDVVRRLFRNRTERLILGKPDPEERKELEELFRQAWRDASEKERFVADRDEDLVPPVQPLSDHIPSSTYAHFEEAGPKYDTYFEAIRKALEEHAPRVVTVAGSGRGPLVQAVLHAASLVGQEPTIYAVEKNPNAAVTLRHRNHREWRERVHVVEADMRTWEAPEKSDLIVSELLGSFGDNELSPECLDGAERFLAPDGLVIPRRSISYLAPLFAPRLAGVPKGIPIGITLSRTRLLAEPKPCFTFDHPRAPEPSTNRREQSLSFITALDGVLDGFVGFFEAELYGDHRISTRPATVTPRMEGWAPLFFPLPRPLDVRAGDEIRATFFRESDGRHVWYEWVVEAPEVLPLQNPGGRDVAMSL